MSLGAAIRQAREARGWTQPELAAKLDIDVQTVWRWEHDVYPIQHRNKLALEAILGPLVEPAVKERSKRVAKNGSKSLKRNNRG